MNRILIAEDDPVMAKLVEFNLKKAGFELMICPDGSSVIDRISDWGPDLAIFDLNLPGKSGLELSQYIQDTPALSHIPVIIITGQGKESSFEELYEAGVKKIFSKPYSPTALAETIRTLLSS